MIEIEEIFYQCHGKVNIAILQLLNIRREVVSGSQCMLKLTTINNRTMHHVSVSFVFLHD